MTKMQISVIMIVYNKEKELPLVLKGFSRLHHNNIFWELIIVDDGSTDHTRQIIEESSKCLPIRLISINHIGNRNILRNIGLRAAQGDRVAFIDGDIVPCKTYLSAHIEGKDNIIILGNRVNSDEKIYEDDTYNLTLKNIDILETLPAKSDERIPHFWIRSFDEQYHKWRFLHSHNFSVNRNHILNVGGFNEELEKWGGDDIELGYRLSKLNLEFQYSFKSGGVHLFHQSSIDYSGYHENLSKIFLKHKHTATELLFIEYLLSPEDSYNAFKLCDMDCKDTLKDTLIKNLSFPVLLNQLSGTDCENTIGIGIYFNFSQKYETYIINGKLASLGISVFNVILENGLKIANEIFIYYEGNFCVILDKLKKIAGWNFQKKGNLICVRKTSFDKVVIEMTRENICDFFLRDFYRYPLMEQLQKKTLCYHSKRLEKNKSINSFLPIKFNEQDIVGDLKVCEVFLFHRFHESYERQKYQKPVSVYYDQNVHSTSEQIYKEITANYDIILLNSEYEVKKCKAVSTRDCKIIEYLPPSVNLKCIPKSENEINNGTFTITFISRYPLKSTGLFETLEIFEEEFKEENDVLFNIILSKNNRHDYRNAYFNNSQNARFTEYANQTERIFYNQINESQLSNKVKIIRMNLNLTQMYKCFNKSDLVIDPTWDIKVPTIAIHALLSGCSIAIGKHNSIYFPFENNSIKVIDTTAASGHLLDFEMNAPMEGNKIFRNNKRLVYYPDKDSIRKLLRSEYNSWRLRDKKREHNDISIYRELFDAEKNAKKLLGMLNEYKS